MLMWKHYIKTGHRPSLFKKKYSGNVQMAELHKMWSRLAVQIFHFFGSQRGILIFATKSAVF